MRAIAYAPWLAAALLSACASTHISSYAPKRREYSAPPVADAAGPAASAGSLWRDGRPASMLFTDARALRENDLVVVKVEEIADAQRRADTDLTHSSQMDASVTAFLKQTAAQGPNAKLAGALNTTFKGEGSTARTERLTATVPALVRRVLPNGNLFIEGHRVVLVNAEEQHFYISGVVRPIDIDQENSIKSSMIADAEIEFTGRGVLTDNQRQGWLSKYLGWIWPF